MRRLRRLGGASTEILKSILPRPTGTLGELPPALFLGCASRDHWGTIMPAPTSSGRPWMKTRLK